MENKRKNPYQEFSREYYRKRVEERLRIAQQRRNQEFEDKWAVPIAVGFGILIIVLVFIYAFHGHEITQGLYDFVDGIMAQLTK